MRAGTTTVSANQNDPEQQNQLIETAINDKVAGILLDPAGADEQARLAGAEHQREVGPHDRAGDLAARLQTRLTDNLHGRDVTCGELGAVLGAHVGPGMLAVCVAPLLT